MSTASDKLRVEDDGLTCRDVGSWAEDKYRLISLYQELFATGMKDKWDERVYLDLYSGAGYSRVRGKSTVLKGSAILALTARNPFDKYILCEEDPALMSALQKRCERMAPDANIEYVWGDCDAQVDKICATIPKFSPTHRVLSLCVVDPFDFGLKFNRCPLAQLYQLRGPRRLC